METKTVWILAHAKMEVFEQPTPHQYNSVLSSRMHLVTSLDSGKRIGRRLVQGSHNSQTHSMALGKGGNVTN